MACTSCSGSSGNKNKSSKSSAPAGTTKNVFKSGMDLLMEAKRIWQQTAEKPVEQQQPEKNNNNNG
jgi:hypothetical protein